MGRRLPFIKGLEKMLLRVMVLSVVLLSVFQLRTITDPVDFYLKVVGDFDTPAFKYEQYVSEDQAGGNNSLISLDFRTEPESPVVVKQNDKVLGVVGSGITLEVEPGTVLVDASHLSYPVTVQIILNEKNHFLELNSEAKSFDIQLKKNSSS